MTAPGGPSGESAPVGPPASEHPPAQPPERPVYDAPWASPASSPAVDYPPYPPPAYQPQAGYPPPSGYQPQPGYPPPSGYQPQPGYQPYPSMPPPYGPAPGGYGPPSYPDPYQYHGGYYPAAEYLGGYGALRTGTNTLAIASLVTSIAGILCCGISSIVGIVLGTIALNQIKQTREEGYGLAVAGIVIGVAALLVYLIVFLFSIPSR